MASVMCLQFSMQEEIWNLSILIPSVIFVHFNQLIEPLHNIGIHLTTLLRTSPIVHRYAFAFAS